MNATEPIKKICVIGANFNNDNLGVGALAYGTLSIITRQFPDAKVFILDYQERPETFKVTICNQILEIPILNIRFSKNVMLANHIFRLILKSLLLRVVPKKLLRDKLTNKNFYLNQIKEADLVLAISGGDSFSDIYGMKRMFYVSLPQLLVLLLDKPLILLPQTIGPFKRQLSQKIARRVLRDAAIVYSRDEEGIIYTQNLLGNKSNNKQLRFSPDVAFVVEPIPSQANFIEGGIDGLLKEDRPLIGLNISGLLYQGGYTRTNMFGLKSNYQELIFKLVQFFIDKKNANLVLIPHVIGKNDNIESDDYACRKIYDAFTEYHGKQLYMVNGDYKPNEMKYIIGQCDFFLGSRMHACIAALSQHIPAVGLAYSRKFAGVLKSVHVAALVLDLRLLTTQEVLHQVNKLYDERWVLRQRLEHTIPPIKHTIMHMFSEAGIQ